jgi:hypothetical protein
MDSVAGLEPVWREGKTTLSPKRREVPNDLKRRSELSAVRDLAQYGSSRRLGLRAVWAFAPFETQRRLDLRHA